MKIQYFSDHFGGIFPRIFPALTTSHAWRFADVVPECLCQPFGAQLPLLYKVVTPIGQMRAGQLVLANVSRSCTCVRTPPQLCHNNECSSKEAAQLFLSQGARGGGAERAHSEKRLRHACHARPVGDKRYPPPFDWFSQALEYSAADLITVHTAMAALRLSRQELPENTMQSFHVTSALRWRNRGLKIDPGGG